MRASGLGTKIASLVSVLAAALAVSCGQRDGGPSERLGVATEALPAPVTISISTPNPVSPLSPVLVGANTVQLGGSAIVVQGSVAAMGSGGTGTQPGATLNDVWSAGPVTLADRTIVRGTLHASSVTLGNGVSIAGRDTTPAIQPPQTLTWTVQYPAGTGAAYTINAGQTVSLAPGLYGTITMNSQSQLNLTSGTYYFSDLMMLNSATTVNLDQSNGPVILYVQNGLTLRGTFVPNGADAGTVHPDLLIGYLGTSQVYVESLFDGAIVAPKATLTLRSVSGTHTGYFAALNINNLDASARVQYRAPLAILGASGAAGATCESSLAALVPASQLASAIQRYCGTCVDGTDSDRDRTPDCADRCPSDPNKTTPGTCGCGHSDRDTDGDGVPDCLDQCPLDPNNVTPGECGCAGDPNVKPAGTACTDPACPQRGATCDGAGVCGNRSACRPGANCRFVSWNYQQYWFCGTTPSSSGLDLDGGAEGGSPDAGDAGMTPGALTETAAASACAAKGLSLTRIDTLSEDRTIDQFLGAPLWLGASSAAGSGNWTWQNNGDAFWSGGATGSPVGNRFAYWAAGSPSGQSCAAMLPYDGHWVDVPCNESLGYVCEWDVPFNVGPDGGVIAHRQPPGITHQPVHAADAGACTPEQDADLPDSLAELEYEIEAGRSHNFIGAAANPPPDGSTCIDDTDPLAQGIGRQPDAGIGCAFVKAGSLQCLSDNDCQPGYVCRAVQDTPGCTPPDASPGQFVDGESCAGHMYCGTISCPTDNLPCSMIEVCDPGTTFDAGLDDSSTLAPHPFDPASLFGGQIPDASASDAYSDPPQDSGVNHTWCHMNPQNPNSVQEATEPQGQLHGHSGGTSKLSFSFDPDLIFDVQANPLALGETKLHLAAGGSLNASFTLNNFFGQTFTGSILKAGIGIVADRCSLDDVDSTYFKVFGLDAIDPFQDFGIPKINTLDATIDPNIAKISGDCNNAVGTFLLWADRAKKAFRDAQQLLAQYHSLTQGGQNFSTDLCDSLGIAKAVVPDFPGGNICEPNETPEITINRFIDYYQGPGTGQIDQLRNAFLGPNGLSSITNKLVDLLHLPSINKQFALVDQEQSETILEVPFAIGPVPMLLEMDVFAGYGVDGNLDVELKFP